MMISNIFKALIRPDPLPGRWAIGSVIVICPRQKSGKQTQNESGVRFYYGHLLRTAVADHSSAKYDLLYD